ncbi:MAG TPA: RidA family protein [Chloroflexota bacterium]|jgi:enamine deaminase RidA (YjgF/YER057c/UK114 family)
MEIEAKIAALGYVLPPPFVYPSPNRRGTVRVGDLLFASGHPPAEAHGVPLRGKVGGDVSEQVAYAVARSCALNILASVREAVGDLDRVRQVVKVTGYVNTAPGFERQFAVIDGASDLFLALWGEQGSHTRSAVGVFELPRGFPVEVEAVFQIGE